VALAAATNGERLLEQCLRHRPRIAILQSPEAASRLEAALRAAGSSVEVRWGPDALSDCASGPDVDAVMAAIVGAAGLPAALAAAAPLPLARRLRRRQLPRLGHTPLPLPHGCSGWTMRPRWRAMRAASSVPTAPTSSCGAIPEQCPACNSHACGVENAIESALQECHSGGRPVPVPSAGYEVGPRKGSLRDVLQIGCCNPLEQVAPDECGLGSHADGIAEGDPASNGCDEGFLDVTSLETVVQEKVSVDTESTVYGVSAAFGPLPRQQLHAEDSDCLSFCV
jgi:hypothetical protein